MLNPRLESFPVPRDHEHIITGKLVIKLGGISEESVGTLVLSVSSSVTVRRKAVINTAGCEMQHFLLALTSFCYSVSRLSTDRRQQSSLSVSSDSFLGGKKFSYNLY